MAKNIRRNRKRNNRLNRVSGRTKKRKIPVDGVRAAFFGHNYNYLTLKRRSLGRDE